MNHLYSSKFTGDAAISGMGTSYMRSFTAPNSSGTTPKPEL